jgi:Dolichyl-phosphate-mannose-protein mannosyltransferase
MRQWLSPRVLVAACLAIGVARIVSTYHVFNQTWDEPAHVAAGMQWLDRGRYTYEPLHPPLARVMVALGPRLAGIRSAGHDDVWLEGNSILYAGGRYERNLALARLGVLPFFLLATLVAFAWARRIGGAGAAVCAVLLFTTLPPVLAHAGIATTDMAVAATVALAVYCLTLWLDRPTRTRGLLLGLTLGLAVIAKLSALLFLPAAAVAVALCRLGARGESETSPGGTRTTRLRPVYIALLLTIWAGYRFAVGPLVPADATRPDTSGSLERVARAPVFPAPALFEGLGELAAKNRAGHKSYLLGEVRSTGWWYFFPVALGVKTPIAFLLLCAAGVVAASRAPPGTPRRRRLEPAIIAFAILLVCLPSRINIGLRHVLPMYPFLAIVAGMGAAALWHTPTARPAARALAILLVGWQLVASAATHPDYLAYFNELAGSHPERILVDSDLDNGQDLKRLADTLRARRIPAVWLAYAGSATVAEHGLPRVRWLEPHRPVTGWVAASLYSLKLGSLDRPGHDDFAWLERHRPVALVGRSIRLYYVPPADSATTAELAGPSTGRGNRTMTRAGR